MTMINFNRKKMITLINEQQESHEKTKVCCICKIKLEHKYANDKIIIKLKTIFIILVNTEVLHITYVI